MSEKTTLEGMKETLGHVDKIREQIRQKCSDRGYLITDEALNTVMEVLFTGVELEVSPREFDADFGATISIKALNRRGEVANLTNNDDPLTIDNMDIKVRGIHDHCVMGIEIPPLSYGVSELFRCKVTIMPFVNMPPFGIKKQETL